MKKIIENEKEGFSFKSIEGNGMENGNMSLIQRKLIARAKGCDTFVDLGAHIGTMSIPVIAKIRPKKSILVEANSDVIPLLKENVAKNLPDLDVEVIHAAICDTDGPVQFAMLEEKSDSSSMYREDVVRGGKKEDVLGMTLDSLMAKTEGSVFLKVDIECAEILMFRALKSTARISGMIIEWFRNAYSEADAKELLGLIRSHGFEVFDLEREPLSDEALMQMGKEDLYLKPL